MDIIIVILLAIGTQALGLLIAFGILFGLPLLFKLALSPAPTTEDRRKGITSPSFPQR